MKSHNAILGAFLVAWTIGTAAALTATVLTINTYPEKQTGEVLGVAVPHRPIATQPVQTPTLNVVIDTSDHINQPEIVIAGTDVSLAKFSFVAVNSAWQVKKFRLLVSSPSLIQEIRIMNERTRLQEGPTLKPNPAGVVMFSGLLTIPANQIGLYSVRATLKPIPTGTLSGHIVSVTMKNDIGTFEAVGGPQGKTTITDIKKDKIGPQKVYRKTKPTLASLPIPLTTLANGTPLLYRLSITADKKGPVSWKHLELEVKTLDTGGAALRLDTPSNSASIKETDTASYIPGSSSITTADNKPCVGTARCIFRATFAKERIIPAGATKSYDVYIGVKGADSPAESVSAALLPDTELVTGELEQTKQTPSRLSIDDLLGTNPLKEYRFIWSDGSEGKKHNDIADPTLSDDRLPGDAKAANDWMNGRLVRTLPGATRTLAR
ncbi:MAG: hypothetical protein Q7S89_00500 [bacterium]|nr:hypothetical protein [bacterium]